MGDGTAVSNEGRTPWCLTDCVASTVLPPPSDGPTECAGRPAGTGAEDPGAGWGCVPAAEGWGACCCCEVVPLPTAFSFVAVGAFADPCPDAGRKQHENMVLTPLAGVARCRGRRSAGPSALALLLTASAAQQKRQKRQHRLLAAHVGACPPRDQSVRRVPGSRSQPTECPYAFQGGTPFVGRAPPLAAGVVCLLSLSFARSVWLAHRIGVVCVILEEDEMGVCPEKRRQRGKKRGARKLCPALRLGVIEGSKRAKAGPGSAGLDINDSRLMGKNLLAPEILRASVAGAWENKGTIAHIAP